MTRYIVVDRLGYRHTFNDENLAIDIDSNNVRLYSPTPYRLRALFFRPTSVTKEEEE